MEKSYEKIGGNYIISTFDYAHKLGRGAFADVYRCRKLNQGKITPEIYVAKEIHFQQKIPQMQELIRQEIKLMLELTGESDTVVKIYDYFNSKNRGDMYIIMEYCEGGDLEKYVEENGPLTEQEIADFLFPVAQSFTHIHRQNIIHRDLKLANILLSKKVIKGQKPSIKITDFGLAYQLEQGHPARTTCGTPLYMAPEIWDKSRKGYTNKIDVWAYGNMLYKMMYGEYVFDDPQVERRIKEGIIRFPKLRLTSLEALDLMLKCFRRNPIKRISFDEIVQHPFFKKRNFEVFDKVFDGYFGYFETNISNEFDLLKDQNCLKVSNEELTAFDIHNQEILKEWVNNERV